MVQLGSAGWSLHSMGYRRGRSARSWLELEYPRWSLIVQDFLLVMLHCPVVKPRLLYSQQLLPKEGSKSCQFSELRNLRALLPTYPIGQNEWQGQSGCEEKRKIGVRTGRDGFLLAIFGYYLPHLFTVTNGTCSKDWIHVWII